MTIFIFFKKKISILLKYYFKNSPNTLVIIKIFTLRYKAVFIGFCYYSLFENHIMLFCITFFAQSF